MRNATRDTRYVDVSGHTIASNICGIPCIILIDCCAVYRGSHNSAADSELDYYGYSEIEFTILDRKGYKAAWLERKLTEDIENRIQAEILAYAETD